VGSATVPWYADAGVDLRLGQPVDSVKPDGLVLPGGEWLPADVTVVAIGVRPQVGWLASSPVKLENGELTIEAESTAWATQLRLLAAKLLAGIAAQVGHNVVTKLHIHGPAAPSWVKGPRRVRGRGPRDTYG